MGFDQLAGVASIPSTLASAARPRLRRAAAGVWGANTLSTRSYGHRRLPRHPDSKRENEGYGAVRQLPSTCGLCYRRNGWSLAWKYFSL